MYRVNGKIVAIIVIIVLIGGGIYFAMMKKNQPVNGQPSPTTDTTQTTSMAPTTEFTTSAAPSMAAGTPTAAMQTQVKHEVTITADGFSPASLTIKAGESVTWINKSGDAVVVASDPHPTHTDYPPLNSVGKIADGESKSFTFPEAGTHGYHDHLNPSFKGTIIVE